MLIIRNMSHMFTVPATIILCWIYQGQFCYSSDGNQGIHANQIHLHRLSLDSSVYFLPATVAILPCGIAEQSQGYNVSWYSYLYTSGSVVTWYAIKEITDLGVVVNLIIMHIVIMRAIHWQQPDSNFQQLNMSSGFPEQPCAHVHDVMVKNKQSVYGSYSLRIAL